MDRYGFALLIVAITAVVVIGWRTRQGTETSRTDDVLPQASSIALKYDTTFGELKEMRVALRPVVHSRVDRGVHAQGAQHAGQSRRTR